MDKSELKELIKQELQTINESSGDYMRAVVLWQLHYETRGRVPVEKIANVIFNTSAEARMAVKSMGNVPKDDIPAYYLKRMDNYSKPDKRGVLKIYKQAVAKLGIGWEHRLREAFISEKDNTMNKEQLKELIRQELEEHLYAHPSKHKGGFAHPGSQPHVKDAKKNAKKKKKTREGVVQEHDRKDILKHLVKKGSNKKEAEKLLDKHYDYLEKRYRKASVAKKAEVLVTLGALDAGR